MLRIAMEFDGVVVEQPALFDDTTSALRFMPNAKVGLYALKRAGHMLLLYSMRANRSRRLDRMLDPLVSSGAMRLDPVVWERNRVVYQARYEQMLAFVRENLEGVFAAVDDGQQGKPIVDLTIDAKSIGLVPGVGWQRIIHLYGEQKP